MFFYNLIVAEGTIAEKIVLALAFLIVAAFSIVIHEFAHAWVAKLNGDLTAKARGRLTLNPVAHFDPVGLLMMLLVGFGWARPVPIDPNNFTNYKRGMFTVSIAGVTANLISAGLMLLILYLAAPVLIFNLSAVASLQLLQNFVIDILVIGVQINFMLALFNLLPIYPLDGFNIVNSFLPHGNPYQTFMVRYGVFCLLALIIIGNVADMFGFRYLDIFGLFGDLITELIYKVLIASAEAFLVL
ncbi:MAG: site-2 protease family protein [Firmicutes bacterium]|uniref:Site-2 protease family protein n=1 Tax=Candidatus Stercoripulliclostridium pullicola TaxID=2840953 RepID=A0A940DGA8_9FIRM|nr:site-2 protease family protein [Candidatus Stercoripulliclostridium pullicola]